MAPAPTARQSRRGGGGLASRILGNGNGRSSTTPDADVGMTDATVGGTDDKRVRSGRRIGSGRQAIGSAHAPAGSTPPRVGQIHDLSGSLYFRNYADLRSTLIISLRPFNLHHIYAR